MEEKINLSKRKHNIWFQLYNNVEKANYRANKKISGCWGFEGEGGGWRGREEQMKHSRFLGQQNHSVGYYNGEYMTSHIGQNL